MATAAVEPAHAQQQGQPEGQQQAEQIHGAVEHRHYPQQADTQGQQQQGQPGQGVEPVQRSLQVGQALAPAQPLHPQGALGQAQGLQGAARPALALAHEVEHGFGGQAGAELLTQVAQLPAPGRQGDAGDEVLRDGPLDKAADLVEG